MDINVLDKSSAQRYSHTNIYKHIHISVLTWLSSCLHLFVFAPPAWFHSSRYWNCARYKFKWWVICFNQIRSLQ